MKSIGAASQFATSFQMNKFGLVHKNPAIFYRALSGVAKLLSIFVFVAIDKQSRKQLRLFVNCKK